MGKLLFVAILSSSLLYSQLSRAADPVEPLSLCDRFIPGPERSRCESLIQDLSPDWYLARICQNQFDDDSFYDCLKLSTTLDFDPRKIDRCDNADFSDVERVSCLKSMARSEAQKSSSRRPASKGK